MAACLVLAETTKLPARRIDSSAERLFVCFCFVCLLDECHKRADLFVYR